MTSGHPTAALKRIACALALGLASMACPARAEAVGAGHVKAELVADRTGVTPGGTIHLALRQDIESGWHTYWRNPGDSGQATTLNWSLPPDWRAGDIVWATPRRLKIGPLMDYGYSGQVLLPVALTTPASARPGDRVLIKAQAGFLVCKDICVPEDATLALILPVVAQLAPADPDWGGPIAKALADAPKAAGLKATITLGSGTVSLGVIGTPLVGADVSQAYFYPYDGAAIDQTADQAIERGPQGLTLALVPGYDFKSDHPPARLDGVLSLGNQAYEVDAVAGPPPPGAAGLGKPVSGGVGRLALMALFAFLGGLILNLMPCVFPVLSMKVAAFARGHDPRAARLQGVAFLGGVVATFLALALALIGARAGGQAIGWGFQLQSPVVVAALALVMLLVALNLSGLFEVGETLQSAGGQPGLAGRSGALGAAFTGALAVVVAAPCTAPFMAGAVGFALTQGPLTALAVFLALGLGFAAPFTALAFAPGLLAGLPRPGPWMDVLRKVLAIPMYLTAVWLAWVLLQQTGDLGIAALALGAAVSIAAAWLYGRAQRRGARLATPLAALVAAFAVAVTPQTLVPPPAPASSIGLESEAFSPARLAQLRAQGGPVFVNFTAAWCVTCQVNDRLALSTPAVAAAFKAAGVTYLKGDWTNRDAAITQALAEHGRAGVPLYLMFGRGGGEPAVLPQILTPGMVVDAAKRAARG